MKLIDKYILINLLRNFAIATFLFLFLGFLTRVFHYIGIITEYGGTVGDFISLILLVQPKILAVLTPFTALIASFITYNSLIHANEHTAIYNTGTSEFGIIRPFLYFAIGLFLLMIYLTSILVPSSARGMDGVHNKIALQVSGSLLKPKEFISQKGLLIFINEANNKVSEGVVILDDRDPAKKTLIISNEGVLGFDGSSILFDANEAYIARQTSFSEFPLISLFKEYKVSFLVKDQLTPNIDNSFNYKYNDEVFAEAIKGNRDAIKQFKIRFGWPFFVILIPFTIIACLLNYFYFTRNRLNLKHLVISFIIVSYVIFAGLFGEGTFNSSIKELFYYYLNIFLIFVFLLFKLRMKFFA